MVHPYRYDHHYCKNCKKRFDCKYTSAEFCQSKCRVAYHRKRNATNKLVQSMLVDMERLQTMDCRSESVSAGLKRIAAIAGQLADEWEYVRPL